MEFIKDAFVRNRWLWFHILGGAVLTLIFLRLFLSPGTVQNPEHWAFLSLLAIALLWEISEFIWKGFIKKNLLETYGSYKRFYADAFGDIAGAVAASIVIILLF